MTCKEIYNEDFVLYQAPIAWMNHNEVRYFFNAMTMTFESRWKMWINTSLVEKMMLGVEDCSYHNITDVVTDEWLSLVGSSDKFPRLTSLNLG